MFVLAFKAEYDNIDKRCGMVWNVYHFLQSIGLSSNHNKLRKIAKKKLRYHYITIVNLNAGTIFNAIFHSYLNMISGKQLSLWSLNMR